MSYKLWIEDLIDLKPPPDNTWKIARSSQEAIDIINEFGVPEFISFDFDLGDGDTSEAIYKYLGNHFYDKEVPDYDIHSENNQGWKMIQSYMDTWKKSKEIL